jgi:hypothetical protein
VLAGTNDAHPAVDACDCVNLSCSTATASRPADAVASTANGFGVSPQHRRQPIHRRRHRRNEADLAPDTNACLLSPSVADHGIRWRGMHLAAQVDELRAAAAESRHLSDGDSLNAFGNTWDLSTRPPAMSWL